MRPLNNISIRAGAFVLLAMGSLGLKAAVGVPRDLVASGDVRRFDQAALVILHSQSFATEVQTFAYRSDLIIGSRGSCRIAVRDAKSGSAVVNVFSKDAESIGPVHYFYRGKEYSAPPRLRVRWGRLEYETMARFGQSPPYPVLVALAASSTCPQSKFGFGDMRLQF